MSVLKVFLLLSCWTFTGTLAENPTATYHVLRNNPVCLNVSKPPPYYAARWEFSDKVIYSDRGINPIYKDKAWPGSRNLSLCIKMLTDNDTGIYKFSFEDKDFNSIFETHQVFIQDMVPRPVMMMMMSEHLSNLTEGSCSLTVNCSIQDNWLWSVCDEDGCKPPQKSFNKFNITIFTDNGTVVCVGNNHVSRNETREEMNTACSSKPTPEPTEEIQQRNGIIYIVAIILGLVCILIFSFLAMKLYFAICKHKATSNAALLIPSGPLETGTQPEPEPDPRVSMSSSSDAEPSYENVDMTQTRDVSIPVEQQFSWDGNGVDTLYSVPKPAASRLKSNGSKESAEHRKTQTSQPATLDPPQTETVYSVLQKPKDLKSHNQHARK